MKNNENWVDARVLSQFSNLSGFSSDQLEKLAASMTVRKLRRGVRIFDLAETADMLYLLLSGTVKLSLVNQGGRDVLLSFLPAGEIFGLGPFLPDAQQPFRADAFSDCRVGIIKPEAFIDALLGVPREAFLRFHKLTMNRVWAMFLRCTRGVGLNLRKRLALALLELSESFGEEHPRGTALTIGITHEDLANSIGVSRQKVTNCLTDFERRRIVTRDGRRLITNPERLCRIIQSA
jgi:CRP/FNR family cyclic AMP-dependent transcriptional regulator